MSPFPADQPSTPERAYRRCELCGHRCGVDRLGGQRGACGAGPDVVLAAAVVHRGEEPCLGGTRGLGNLFVGGCSLRCLFCQNHDISQAERGRVVTPARLADAMLALARRGVGGIGLVTPTHVAPSVATALRLARARGLRLPVIHNGSAVDTPAALAPLRGLVDVYLPDLKWASPRAAGRYSGAPWYPQVARQAIRAMADQVGPLRLDGRGLARSGLLVRHLVLPEDAAGSAEALAWLAGALGDGPGGPGALSLLRQYTPRYRAVGHPVLGRPVTDDEYDEVVDLARWLGFDPIYVQGPDSTEVGVPDWDDPAVFRW